MAEEGRVRLEQVSGRLLLPVPQEISGESESFYEGSLPDAAALAGYLVGRPLPPPIVDSGRLDSLPAEGYELRIEREEIRIASADEAGTFYGIQTLRQLLRASGGGHLPCGVIGDWPDLRVRGFMIDVSRSKVPTMGTFTELIELLALLKVNQLQLYTEHTFAYVGHEEVWRDASPVTPLELRELDNLCHEHAIELVPNQNSFGHMKPWLTRKRYRHLAEAPDGFVDPWGNRRDYPYSLSPAEPATLDFLDGLYSQLLPNVRSGKLNVGCDETFDLGQGRSGELCRKRGKGMVYLDYLNQIHRLLQRHGKQMLFYADIVQEYPETIPLLPRDMVAIEWGYEADHPFEEHCRRLAEAGLEFYVAPGTSSWNSFAGRWGVARENIVASLRAAHKWKASGMLLTEWGDNGYLQPFVAMLPGLIYAAGGAWNRSSLLFEPWSWLSRHLFLETGSEPGHEGEPDRSSALRADDVGPLASALRLLAELYRVHPEPIPNASIFGVVLLLAELPMYAGYLESFDSRGRHKARELLRQVDVLLEASETREASAPSGRQSGRENRRPAISSPARRELELARGLVELALDVADSATLTDLDTAVARLEREHRELWRERFRPGGLELSCSFLRKRVDSGAGRGGNTG